MSCEAIGSTQATYFSTMSSDPRLYKRIYLTSGNRVRLLGEDLPN